jgi:hypothetical protein
MAEKRSPFDDLPNETIMNILEQGDWDSLRVMEQVSWRCRQLALAETKNRLRPFIPEVSELYPELKKSARDLTLLMKTLGKIPNLLKK